MQNAFLIRFGPLLGPAFDPIPRCFPSFLYSRRLRNEVSDVVIIMRFPINKSPPPRGGGSGGGASARLQKAQSPLIGSRHSTPHLDPPTRGETRSSDADGSVRWAKQRARIHVVGQSILQPLLSSAHPNPPPQGQEKGRKGNDAPAPQQTNARQYRTSANDWSSRPCRCPGTCERRTAGTGRSCARPA